ATRGGDRRRERHRDTGCDGAHRHGHPLRAHRRARRAGRSRAARADARRRLAGRRLPRPHPGRGRVPRRRCGMTATTHTTDALAGARLSGAGIVGSEWIKLVTLRSTWWCLGVLAAITAGLPALI